MVKWVPAEAFHLPPLPEELKIDPILASLLHMACFMEFSAEGSVDFDESVTAMETMGYYFQRLKPKQIKEVDAQLKRVAAHGKKAKWKKEVVEFIAKLLAHAGIEE